MSTPGKPRQSGIPTPGRSRSASSTGQYAVVPDVEYMSRAFADAIKANDPAQHRPHSVRDASPVSISLQSHSYTSVRPTASGVATSSAPALSKAPLERSKTPTSVRPPSRHSDVFGRSASRAGRIFDVGDNVRIESLGYEGTLKYLGEIDGKLGLWAGVELSGGFAGKGKNNGAVSGKQYFTCPPLCGVFVAATKLSPPTVGAGAILRPSSTTSSQSGRVTPSFSGRVTPSTSMTNGRITPSASLSHGRITPSTGRTSPSLSTGRVTPGITPSSRTRTRTLSKPASKLPGTPSSAFLANKITAGSRASKYVSMTAKQLTSRDSGPSSPSHRVFETVTPPRPASSSAQASIVSSSPTRSSSSPFNTPKPYLSGRTSNIGSGPSIPKGRPSLNTPRARIPSAVAMPPPPSPSSSSRSALLSDSHSERNTPLRDDTILSDLEMNGRSLQNKIAQLMSERSPSLDTSSSRPASATSVRSAPVEQRDQVERLQSRLDALEYENERLRSLADASEHESQQAVIHLESERDQLVSRVSQLEADLRASALVLTERQSLLDSLEAAHQKTIADLEYQKQDGESRIQELKANLERIQEEANEMREAAEREHAAQLEAKASELVSLEAQLELVRRELEDERKELGAQIDELRSAGQETIALYEERLSAVESQRYELENHVVSLEGNKPIVPSSSTTSTMNLPSSAIQIDNETLRDQIHHLQKKIATMEDILEDAHATSERDESALRERMRRLKEKEEAMKIELTEGRKEVERMIKSEASAKNRVEEIEEALRESTVALENARAEVEVLRAEIADLDGVVASTSHDTPPSLSHRASSDRSRFMEEIKGLKDMLEESQATIRSLSGQRNTSPQSEYRSLGNMTEGHSLNSDPAREDQQEQLDQERRLTAELRRSLDERSAELESLRKRHNRDATVNGGNLKEPFKPSNGSPQPATPTKYDISSAREEITGLKHIVQELQKENLAATQRIKLLESENQLLVSEIEQLRQEVKILEDNIDQSLLREEEAVDGTSAATSGDMESMQRYLKEQKVKYEAELDQLRKKLAEAEMKSARTAHDLNKEISELEALVESKIYREDELEQELERLKDKLVRSQKKSSKNSLETSSTRSRVSSLGSGPSAAPQEDVCEICERPGHDIFNCDLLKEDPVTISKSTGRSAHPTSPMRPRQSLASDLFCEDCESHGHVASDCPHSLDVF